MIAAFAAALAVAGSRGVEGGVAAPAGLERAYASRRVALVVGIDVYDDPALGNLTFAAKDATDMAAVLRDPEIGGYDAVSVVAGEVTKEAFWSAFQALASTIHRDDTVLVYLAGHGTLDLGAEGTELYLLGSDAWLSDAGGTGIRVDALAEAVTALPARRKVIVLDACYSGSGRSVLDPSVAGKLETLRGPVPSPRALVVSEFQANLYAAHIHQPSIEDATLQNGVYTHFFVEALRGSGDMDGDGLVEVMEAHGYARDQTLAFTGGTQVPWAETVSVGRAVLHLAGDPTRRTASEHAWLTGLEALPADARVTVDGARRGAGVLDEGRHRIEVAAADEVLLDRKISVVAGERLDLGREIARDRGLWLVSLGGSASGDDRILGSVKAVAGLVRSVRDRGWGRFEVRSQLAAGSAPIPASGRPFPAGTLTVGGGWFLPLARGPLLELGPSIGGGLAWRLPEDPGPQASALVMPAASIRAGRTVFAEVRAEAAIFRADRATVAVPAAVLAFGLRQVAGSR